MLENIQITKKDVKNITLKVKPSGEVILTAPKITSDEHIKFIIKKRAKWIEKKKEFFASFETSEKEYVSGEDFKYLGRSYRLKVIESNKEVVKIWFTSGIMKKHYFIFSIFYKSLIKLLNKR